MKFFPLVFFLVSCAHAETKQEMGNPASILCVQKGGLVSIAKDHDGNEGGMCNLDRAMVPEWTLYHELNGTKTIAIKKYLSQTQTEPSSTPGQSMSNPATLNCIKVGGKVEIYWTEQGQFGICKFEDKSEIEEWTLFHGASFSGNAKLTALVSSPTPNP